MTGEVRGENRESAAKGEQGEVRKPVAGSVPRFLPKWLGGKADRVDGHGVRLPVRQDKPRA